jgi:hypothetical protein
MLEMVTLFAGIAIYVEVDILCTTVYFSGLLFFWEVGKLNMAEVNSLLIKDHAQAFVILKYEGELAVWYVFKYSPVVFIILLGYFEHIQLIQDGIGDVIGFLVFQMT